MDLWFSEHHTKNVRLQIKVNKHLFSGESEYQRIDVFESYEFGRFLTLDGYMMLTEKDEFIYHEMITHVPMAVHPNVEKVLVIGAGDGGVIRELTRYDTIKEIDMVEIDEMVVEVCKQYLPKTACKFDDPRLRIYYQDLLEYFDCKTVVFAGQSGTGKSTIINAIVGYELMETGCISEKIERGRHTTRHTNFIHIKSGAFIADTPGFSNVEPEGIDEKELHLYYPEFKPWIGQCKFQTCVHIKEPGCAVKEKVQQGSIGDLRYENYSRMYYRIMELNKQKRGY
jgi:ribosome small subunit-dependent GTPase A